MAMTPCVSIVLPCYNGASHLADSIESCLVQTYTDWELIIVDDCSTDNSASIMQHYAATDSRIRTLTNAHNLKLPASLNRGFDVARGRYLTWTSHDNRMAPTMIEEMVHYLDDHPECGLVTANYDAFSLTTGETLYSVCHPDPQRHMPLFNTVCYAFLYRSEVLQTVGQYNTNLFLVEDYDYWIRIWQRYPIGKIYRTLYHTGVGSDTLTLSRKAEIAQRLLDLRMNHLGEFETALSDDPRLQARLYTSMADAMHGRARAKFILRCLPRNPWHFAAYYLLRRMPHRALRHIAAKLKRTNTGHHS